MSWEAAIDVDLRHAAHELAAAEEYVVKKHWRFAMSSLLTATAPLEHLYTLRRHLTAEQRKDVSAMVARVETMWRQALRGSNADDQQQQQMRRRA
jgi:hypothetical protein